MYASLGVGASLFLKPEAPVHSWYCLVWIDACHGQAIVFEGSEPLRGHLRNATHLIVERSTIVLEWMDA